MAKTDPRGESLGGDRLWTVAEVAEHMRVSKMTVYRLIKAGELAALRVGRTYRIRGRELAGYLHDAELPNRQSGG